LTILASGPDSARPALEPIFAALASRVIWVGEAGMGSRLKLAANHYMVTTVAALAESMHLCEAMGLSQGHFIDLLDDGPLGSSYGMQKLDEMRRHEYPAGFPVRLALKDLELVREVEVTSWRAPTRAGGSRNFRDGRRFSTAPQLCEQSAYGRTVGAVRARSVV
jgi:3-hydroxyisobutyrate dehydrogenase-like beta-hydroxyacid dehydrogenase